MQRTGPKLEKDEVNRRTLCTRTIYPRRWLALDREEGWWDGEVYEAVVTGSGQTHRIRTIVSARWGNMLGPGWGVSLVYVSWVVSVCLSQPLFSAGQYLGSDKDTGGPDRGGDGR